MKSKLSMKTLMVAALVMIAAGCQKNDDIANVGTNSADNTQRFPVSASYMATNLVSDVSEYSPAIIDTNLVNAWGLAFSPLGGVWISSNETHVSAVYNKNGITLHPPVYIPFETDGANPTGQVFNSSSTFIIPSTSEVSKFIFVTENGTIAAWASGNSAITVADRSAAGAVYKGVEIVNNSGQWFLYAADFHNNKVDMFDQNFNFIGNSMFADATMPAGFAPFNIRRINDHLYVAYAKQLAPDNHDDEAGPGNGYVNVFNLDGSFVQRFASQGMLNSPWGIEKARENNGVAPQAGQNSNAEHTTILIGNFGDGHISAFDENGNFLGQLMHEGQPLVIDGLWSISYPPSGNPVYMDVRNRLYFTAGPDHEDHGVFGFISR